jgi:16S rRNA processing protein RimM
VLVPIGTVGRPHGLDGAFVVERASTDDRRWRVGTTVLVDGVPATITLVRRAGGARRAIRLDRDARRGAELAVLDTDLPPPDHDSYYVFQLVGLAAVDEDGVALGRVVDVHTGAANDNAELEDGTLVPLVEDAVREVDLEGGRLVVARGFL